MAVQAKRVAITTIFGATIFIVKTLAPSPIDKMLIFVQALLLALGALLLRRMGATYVAAIGGILTALWRTALAPFTLLFAVLFGFFIDGFFYLFKVNIKDGRVRSSRLVVAMTLSTMLVGLSSYYMSVSMELLPRNPIMEVSILVAGTLSGAAAGYFAAIIWNKHLKNFNP